MVKRLIGPFHILVVAAFPVFLLLMSGPTPFNFVNSTASFDSLGRIMGLIALSLLSLNIILSARLGIYDRLFLGMDRAYRFHRIIGGLVLILLLLHAMLITAKYSNISLLSGYEFLKPNLDFALMAGKLGLAVILAAVFMSMYIGVQYAWFIRIQRLLGAMIFIGGYHALFVTSTDLQTNPFLLSYFIIIGGLAAGLYVYRSLLHKSIKKRLQYEVESITVSENIAIIWLQPLGRALPFYAGQFGFYRFYSSAVTDESHPFSISSGSNDTRLRLSVKAIGDYTTAIQLVKVGDMVSVEGPYGNFSFTKIQSTKQVWVAGGIGITPFLSMAQSVPSGYDVTLFYCTRTLREAQIFLDELMEITKVHPGFHVITICEDQAQRLSVDVLKNVGAPDYLLCAPIAMTKDLEKQLIKSGVSRDHVYYEEFRLK